MPETKAFILARQSLIVWLNKSLLVAVLWLLITPGFSQEVASCDSRGSNYSYTQEELECLLSNLRGSDDQTRAYEAVISLFVDECHITEILARISHDGTPPELRYRDIKQFLCDTIDREFLIDLGEEQDLHGWISLLSLDPYCPVFNEDNLSLNLTTPAGEREEGRIDLMPMPECDLGEALKPERCSAYLNFYNQVTFEQDDRYYALNLEGAARWHPWAIEARWNVDPERINVADYNNLRAICDFPEKLIRVTIGETQSFSPRILSSDRIQGIKYSTQYDLQPRVVTEPISEYSFLLQRDSTVEVWINDEFVDQLRLDAGPYDVLNFPLRLGLNRVQLRITDDLGRAQTLSFDTIKGPNLLAPGRKEFCYSAGVRGQGNDYNGKAIVSASMRRGFTETITGAVEMRADSEQVSGDVGVDFATSWFHGNLDVGIANTNFGTGPAARVILSRSFENLHVTYRLDYHSEKFLVQEQNWDAERLKVLHELAITVPRIYDYWGSLRFYAQDLTRWNGKDDRIEELSWHYTINSRWSIKSAVSHSHTNDPEWDWRALISYSYYGDKFWRRHDGRVGRSTSSIYSTIGGNPHSSRFGDWTINHSHIRPYDGDPTDNLRGAFRYKHCRFHALYTIEVGDFADQNDIKQILNLNTAVACAGGRWSMGEPILNSFAIITPEKTLGDICLKACSCGREYTGSRRLPILVSNLRPYWPHFIHIEPENFEVCLDQPPFFLFPSHKSGFVLTAANEMGLGGSITITGTLLNQEGEVEPYKALFLHDLNNSDEAPFVSFTNNEGFFSVGGVLPGHEFEIRIGNNDPSQYGQIQPLYQLSVPADIPIDREFTVGNIEPINKEMLIKADSIPPPTVTIVKEAVSQNKVFRSTDPENLNEQTWPNLQEIDLIARISILEKTLKTLEKEETALQSMLEDYHKQLGTRTQQGTITEKLRQRLLVSISVTRSALEECRLEQQSARQRLIDLRRSLKLQVEGTQKPIEDVLQETSQMTPVLSMEEALASLLEGLPKTIEEPIIDSFEEVHPSASFTPLEKAQCTIIDAMEHERIAALDHNRHLKKELLSLRIERSLKEAKLQRLLDYIDSCKRENFAMEQLLRPKHHEFFSSEEIAQEELTELLTHSRSLLKDQISCVKSDAERVLSLTGSITKRALDELSKEKESLIEPKSDLSCLSNERETPLEDTLSELAAQLEDSNLELKEAIQTKREQLLTLETKNKTLSANITLAENQVKKLRATQKNLILRIASNKSNRLESFQSSLILLLHKENDQLRQWLEASYDKQAEAYRKSEVAQSRASRILETLAWIRSAQKQAEPI